MGKSTWFKGGGGKKNTLAGGTSRRGRLSNGDGGIKTRTVIFVEHTPGGELSKRIRERNSILDHY